jgi:AP-1 complex subunit gamma-1
MRGCLQALSSELLAYLEVTDEAFKPSLTEHLCLLTQKYSPSTRWYIDQLLNIMVAAGTFVTVWPPLSYSCAFIYCLDQAG